jgi:TP901 family phage tail tape measure protein
VVTIGTLRGVLELEDRFSVTMGVAAKNLSAFADKSDDVGKKLSLAFTAPLAAIAAATTKTFLSFDNAMRGVEAALAPTTAELQKLEAAALEWGAKTQFSATQSAQALGELGKAGFDVNESIATLPHVLNLATVSGMNLAEAATLTADTMKQMNLTIADAGMINDVLAAGAQKSTADVQQLAQALKFVGPVAAGMNMTFEDTVAVLAEFHNVGLKADMAGTSLRNILTDLVNPTKGMKDGLEQLGIETLRSADGTFKMAEVIETLRDKMVGAYSETDRTALVMKMFGDRGGVAMTAVINKGTEGLVKLQEQMKGAQGTAKDVADILMKGLGGAFERFTGALETAGTSIGSVFAPALILGLGWVTNLAEGISSTLVPAFLTLPHGVQLGVGALLLFAASIGPVLIVISKLTQTVAYLADTAISKQLVTAMFTLGNTTTVLTVRLWLLEASEAAVAASTLTWSRITAGVKGVLDTLGISTVLQTSRVWLLDTAQKAAAVSANAMTLAGSRVTAGGIGAVAGTLGTIAIVIASVVGAVRLLTGSWEKTWEVIKGGIPPLHALDFAWRGIVAVLGYLAPALSSTISFLNDVATIAGFLVHGVLSSLFKWVSDLAQVGFYLFNRQVELGVAILTSIYNVARDVASLFSGLLYQGLQGTYAVIQILVPGFGLLVDAMKGASTWASELWASMSKLRQQIADVAEGIRGVMPGMTAIPAMFKATKPALEGADQLIARMGNLLEGEQKLRLAIDATGKGYGTLAQQLQESQSIVKALTTEQKKNIDAGLKMGASTEQIIDALNKMGHGVKLTEGALNLYKDTQQQTTRATKDHQQELEKTIKFYDMMGDSVWDTTQRLRDLEQKRIQEAMTGAERLNTVILDTLRAKTEAEQATAAVIRELTMSELEFKLDAIDREVRARKAGFDLTTQLGRDAAASLDKYASVSMEKLVRESKEFNEVLNIISLTLPTMHGFMGEAFKDAADKIEKVTEKTEGWKGKLRELSQAFANMSEIGGGLGTFSKIAGDIISATDVALQSFDKVSEGIKKLADSTKKDLAGALGDIAIGLVGGFGAMMEATDPEKSLVSKLVGGAATGAALGGAIGLTIAKFASSWSAAGPWGAVAGAVVGILVAVFRGREARREMEIVGTEWGQDISKGLFESIHKASQFGGNRVANSLFRMSEFISEAGGVDSTNLEGFTSKLHDVFSALEQNLFDIDVAQKIVNDNFADIANAAVASGRLASDALLEIIALNQTMNVQAQEIINFVSSKLGEVGIGIQTIAQPITAAITTWHDEVVKTEAALAKMQEEGKVGTDEWITAQQKLTGLAAEHGVLVANNAADLEHLGVVAVASFAGAIRSGVGYVQAIRQVGPGLDAIIAAQEKLGLTSENAAIKDLVIFRDKVKQNEALVAAAESLDSTLLAVSYTTGLTGESLASMGALGVSTFDKLIAANFTETEALRMMAPFLQDLIDGHMDLGIPIEDNVGRLVNMASQFGILGKDSKSFEEKFTEGISTLTDAINELIRAMGKVPGTVDNIGAAINRVPKDMRIGVKWDIEDLNLPGGGRINIPDAHGGLPMRDWGHEGTLVRLHNKEGVFTEGQMRDIYEGVRSNTSGANGGGVSVVQHNDFRGAFLGDEASKQRFVEMIEQAVDSVAGARRQVRA